MQRCGGSAAEKLLSQKQRCSSALTLPSIGLPCQVEVVGGKLWVRGEKCLERVPVRLRLRDVVPSALRLPDTTLDAVRETRVLVHGRQEGTCRRLQVQHVGNVVPRLVVHGLARGGRDLEVPCLGVLAIDARAAGPARVPRDDGVRRVALRSVELVVDVCAIVAINSGIKRDVQEARVRLKGPGGGKAWQRRHQIGVDGAERERKDGRDEHLLGILGWTTYSCRYLS